MSQAKFQDLKMNFQTHDFDMEQKQLLPSYRLSFLASIEDTTKKLYKLWSASWICLQLVKQFLF